MKRWKWYFNSLKTGCKTQQICSWKAFPQAASWADVPICLKNNNNAEKKKNCLNPNCWFLNTILGALERVAYGKSIRQLILKTKTWQVHLLINSSVGAHITSATGVLKTINPRSRQGEPYWHIFLIWIFNYSEVPHQIRVKLGTGPEIFTQLQRG